MNKITFDEVLELADKLDLEEQENLVEILHNRIRANRRYHIIQDVQETEREFKEGKCKPVSIDELIEEILE